ncbi:efflux transporter periplasmic adaptor subunit [Caulobacter flavus]|uniref:Efflux transporter periplasmic adaptor subunit n=1 Tax=Caulobacter flavus TaxID=1679497 RepID=A0A2N5CUQ6_9CAUL|nr:efflux RND transporter periplasmic adaptor subunit [Caulobacter flavus]AYV44999.1 efflux transporter periplasmic adaptor subunit [Caulobacter flavus]PLR17267.1 efflux transporter periplasmic adaptor subunit [Caulobacter flavus]
MAIKRPLAASAVLLAAVSLTLAACGQGKGGAAGGMGAGGPTPVGVVVVKTEPVTLTSELQGRTSAYLVSEVRPQVGGIVKARLFQEGGYVRAGQPLYQIEPATFQAAVNSAQAGLAQAQATYTAAKLKADRYKELVAVNAVSKQDNDDAQAAAQQASANVAAQKAALDTARINLGWTRVVAPISGRIGKSSVTPGALVTASQTNALATIQNLDKIYVDLTQSSAELLQLQRDLAGGQLGRSGSAQVSLKLEDGSTYPTQGRLEFSDVTVDQTTGSFGLRATFDNPNGTLLPGMYVRATLGKGVASNGVLIPQAGVSRDPKGNATVTVVGAKGLAEIRPITVGQTVGDKWLVTSGLKVGDQVIVEGLQKVRPGAPVKPAVITAQR